MFCVNCGNKLEEEWKVCPKCGTEVIKQKEEKKIETLEKRVCEKCGNELQDDWVKCPFCGYTKEAVFFQQEKEQNVEVKKFEFEGFRRTGRFGFKYYKSEVEVSGEQVHAIIHKKKEQEVTFLKQQIEEIKFPTLPLLRVWDIVCIVLFLALMFVSYGMSVFAVLLFVKMTLVKNMQIILKNNQKLNVPIRQKADTVAFLKEIGWSESMISKIEASAVSDRKIIIREWIVSGLMLALAAATVTVGMETYLENREMNGAQTYEQGAEVRSLEEVGGYEAWVESEYASKVRTVVVVTIPTEEIEEDKYAANISISLDDAIYIREKEGVPVKKWKWLANAEPDSVGEKTALFEMTLTLDSYSGGVIPIFIIEDIEAYTVKYEDKYAKFDFSGNDNTYSEFYDYYGNASDIFDIADAESYISFAYGTWYDEKGEKIEISDTHFNGKKYGVCAIANRAVLIYFYGDKNELYEIYGYHDVIAGEGLSYSTFGDSENATNYSSMTTVEYEEAYKTWEEEQAKIQNYSDDEIVNRTSAKAKERLSSGYSATESLYHSFNIDNSTVSYDWTTRTYTCNMTVTYSSNVFDFWGTSSSSYDIIATYSDTGTTLVATGFSMF